MGSAIFCYERKIRLEVENLKNTDIVVPTTNSHYNVCLLASIYFGRKIMHVLLKQEELLNNTCKLGLLKKISLSMKFLTRKC